MACLYPCSQGHSCQQPVCYVLTQDSARGLARVICTYFRVERVDISNRRSCFAGRVQPVEGNGEANRRTRTRISCQTLGVCSGIWSALSACWVDCCLRCTLGGVPKLPTYPGMVIGISVLRRDLLTATLTFRINFKARFCIRLHIKRRWIMLEKRLSSLGRALPVRTVNYQTICFDYED